MESLEAMRDDQRQILRLAIPSDLPGGLDAPRSGHFGRSPSFTIVDVVDDVVVNAFMRRPTSRTARATTA